MAKGMHCNPALCERTTDKILNHHKHQAWGFCNNVRVEKPNTSKLETVIASTVEETRRHGDSLPKSTSHETFYKSSSTFSQVPKWKALANQVLRFYGYIDDVIEEDFLLQNNLRNEIDDTVQLQESYPKEQLRGHVKARVGRNSYQIKNSGLLSPKQLDIGKDIDYYSRILHFTGCDAFTRVRFRYVTILQREKASSK
ncbi:hypothetical protein IE077_002937 [Cardiosporidium cionae]|uniref:DM10 domain-containing protein n=1 Tax=Cardiosporidium cionae TaxID=476202 RepID=A0ABQ7J9I7_9APIC|nr:hypothetical protein IE077_002937 [Cardiosporidium cionae]|eukprot:KAF8820673.1 hypothetical protein IE077_002937 [Cardiosporidium cionae]